MRGRNAVIIPHFYVVSELNVAMMERTQRLGAPAALAQGKWLLQLPHLLQSRRLMPGTFPVQISRAAAVDAALKSSWFVETANWPNCEGLSPECRAC